ncbi:MAG TPA: carboxymuconolactone decarboxylase family protein [Candidatus Nanopelagicales bacterium]|nr:carboxymuconolactone decarboxylase family protein [Candidatus Nanopelagicales bacterium]
MAIEHGKHEHGKAVQEPLAPLARNLRQAIPDVYAGFKELHAGAMAEGALPTKMKELIALTLSVHAQCDGCIASHARGAARAGATKEEAAEAIGVTFLMQGGPATVYGPRAYDAFCEYYDAQHGAQS